MVTLLGMGAVADAVVVPLLAIGPEMVISVLLFLLAPAVGVALLREAVRAASTATKAGIAPDHDPITKKYICH